MKTYNFIILFWVLVFMGACLALTSCTEEIFIDKWIKGDTVFISKPQLEKLIIQTDTVVIVDTVKVEVIIRDTVINNIHTTDTLIQVVTKDSIIIREVEKLVTIYDTIINNLVDTVYVTDTVFVDVIKIEQRVIYHDTLYLTSVIREVTSIPDEFLPHVEDFMAQTVKYNKPVRGGNMIIHYVKQADLPGEGWTSNSFNLQDVYSGQIVIQISEEVPHEQAQVVYIPRTGKDAIRQAIHNSAGSHYESAVCNNNSNNHQSP